MNVAIDVVRRLDGAERVHDILNDGVIGEYVASVEQAYDAARCCRDARIDCIVNADRLAAYDNRLSFSLFEDSVGAVRAATVHDNVLHLHARLQTLSVDARYGAPQALGFVVRYGYQADFHYITLCWM